MLELLVVCCIFTCSAASWWVVCTCIHSRAVAPPLLPLTLSCCHMFFQNRDSWFTQSLALSGRGFNCTLLRSVGKLNSCHNTAIVSHWSPLHVYIRPRSAFFHEPQLSTYLSSKNRRFCLMFRSGGLVSSPGCPHHPAEACPTAQCPYCETKGSSCHTEDEVPQIFTLPIMVDDLQTRTGTMSPSLLIPCLWEAVLWRPLSARRALLWYPSCWASLNRLLVLPCVVVSANTIWIFA